MSPQKGGNLRPTRCGVPRRLSARRGQPARRHHRPLEHPNLELAPRPRVQRRDRSREQSEQTRQTRRLRFQQLHQLPDQSTPVCRQTQLEPTRHPHSDLKREDPGNPTTPTAGSQTATISCDSRNASNDHRSQPFLKIRSRAGSCVSGVQRYHSYFIGV